MSGLILGKYVDGAGQARFVEVAVDASGRVLMVQAGPDASLTDAQLRASAVLVTAGQITTATAAITGGQSLSATVDLGTARLGRIVMPTVAAGWDAANLTLQTSVDGVTWNNLHDKDGAEYTITAAAGRSILIPLADMLSVRYLRIRSGTSAAAVNQTAARSLTLVLVP